MLQEANNKAKRNIARVRNLIDVYASSLKGKGKGRRGIEKLDVLRSAVVFLHSTLEDFLRTLGEWKLPDAGSQRLSGIPLASVTDEPNRKEKFLLGDLVDHKARSVEELISLSVKQQLERVSYNTVSDVVNLLNDAGCDINRLRSRILLLEPMMKRRHRIVHHADKNMETGKGHHWAAPINDATVMSWTNQVESLFDEITAQLQ